MFATIIFGKAATGKSRYANYITRNEKSHAINGREFRKSSKLRVERLLSDLLRYLPINTTIIHIDDWPAKHLPLLADFLLPQEIQAEERGKDPKIISPKVIVTCDGEYNPKMFGASHMVRFDFITCIENKDHEVAMIWHHPKQRDAVFAF